MYGASGKLGRGAGSVGRGAKRLHSPFPPPPSHRSIAPAGAASGRLSIGGGAARNRHTGTAPAATPSAREETFSLVSGGDPLAFAMIIRLAPNLVDEIRRVEDQGGVARMKFDSNANNPSGNVIDVGGKDFRFTWSHEPGDLCDIYEERQGGEDGNGLLVEAGGAWRKLNVQRILDESTKNHVKMRSEEAERKLKSRKAIVLDHGNPSVKNQMKTLAAAAVDMNTRRMPFKQKHEPAFKKRKVEPAQAAGGVAPKSAFKLSLSSTSTSKGRLSVSPVPSPPEQFGASASPIGTGNFTRSHTGTEEVIAPQVTNKDETASNEKEMPTRAAEATAPIGNKMRLGASSLDLQSMLITLLLENPKGMSLKALEKAIGDTVPNCAKKIEPIIKKIANFQAPGRYILRQGVELESLKKPPSESGSSPECIRGLTFISEKAAMDEFEQQSALSPKPEELNQLEKIGSQQDSPDLFGDKKASDHSDGHACSSSESGSDSDSESDSGSDSGSGSGSQSRSPVGSGSGSSSDSESDGSSSNKEGSDVDVDIMTSDDDKEEAKHKLQNPNPGPDFSMSPVPWQNDGHLEQNGFDVDKQDGQIFVRSETAKDLHNHGHDINMVEITDSAPNKANSRALQDSLPFSPDHNHIGEQKQLTSVGNFVDEWADKREASHLEPSESSGKLPKSKSKMSYDKRGQYEKSESAKKMKTVNSTQPHNFTSKEAIFSESPHYLSPDQPDKDLHKDPALWMTDRIAKGGTEDSSLQRGYGLDMPGKPVPDAHQLGQRTGDLGTRGNASEVVERPRKYIENSGRGVKQSERNSTIMDEDGSTMRSTHAREKLSTTKDKGNRETQDEDGNAYEKSITNDVRQVDGGDKPSMPLKSQYRKQGEQVGRLKDAGQMANSRMGPNLKEDNRTDMDRSLMVNGKVLRRELSDLELGELREPIHSEEGLGVKKKLEKKNSFKLSDNKLISSDNFNPDSSKGRTAGKTIQDSRKKCSPDSLVGAPTNQEDLFRKRITEDDDEGSIMPQQRIIPSQAQHFSRMDHADSEVGPPLNKSAEVGIKSRNNEGQRNQVIGLEGYGSTHKKAPTNVFQQHEPKHEGRTVGLNSIKDGKSLKSNTVTGVNGRKKDILRTQDSNNGSNGSKKRESSSDNDSCSYSKFEKDEPELKGPIKDISQYKEYVQEYLEKYDSYCSLNRSLETYRNDFGKLGRDLQLAKDGDSEQYFNILEQLKANYRQCGERHKRLKKIFIVLHEELQHLKQRIREFALTYERD